MEQHLQARPIQAEHEIKKNGVTYRELVRLPYFDITHQQVIQHMHTFDLGTVKAYKGTTAYEQHIQ